ncbi:MAG: hypothetical protein SGI87_08170 [Flavobacteriales bacterium]|nr:hypothetical protein [Flavobacteriales bacterium]
MNLNNWIIVIAMTLIILSSLILLIVWRTKQLQKLKIMEWQWMLKLDNNKAIANLRVSACERLVIMLERIHPDSLVLRQNIATSNATMLQMELIKGIREEYEHNVSLQLYVSDECWQYVRFAKDEMLEVIKISYTKVRPENTAMDLSREIFKLSATLQSDPVKSAIAKVKREITSSV